MNLNKIKKLNLIYLISFIISFIAIIIAILSMLWSTYLFKIEIKFIYVIMAIFAALLGSLINIAFYKLTTKKYKSKIYISFSDKDSEIAQQIRRALIHERFILNIDEKNIQVGENIKQALTSEIKSSSIFIVLISKYSINSDFVKLEIQHAIKNNKIILPVLIDKNISIPSELKDLKYANFIKNQKEALNELIIAVKNNLKKLNQPITKSKNNATAANKKY